MFWCLLIIAGNFVIHAVMSSHKESVMRLRQFTFFSWENAFSQDYWHPRPLIIDDLSFRSALHYMLYEKASEY